MKTSPVEEFVPPILLTVQGQARSGKGTLARALKADLEKDYAGVYLVDQGLKFRVIADQYLRNGGDIEDIEAIGLFLESDGYTAVLGQLALISNMNRTELNQTYYTFDINNASGMVGKSEVAQRTAVKLLFDEVKSASAGNKIIILDGRAMFVKGKKLQDEGLVHYPLALDVKCSSLVAAQRVTGLVKPIEELTADESMKLLQQISDIDKRNSADARRKVYPSLPISGALEFDVTHPHNDEELAAACAAAAEIGAISLDNSYTRKEDEFTQPAIKLVRCVLSKVS